MCKTIDLKHFLNNLYLVFSVGNFQGLNFRFHVQNLRATLTNYHKGPSINYLVSGARGGSKFPILLSKKTTKSDGGGQKLPIL